MNRNLLFSFVVLLAGGAAGWLILAQAPEAEHAAETAGHGEPAGGGEAAVGEARGPHNGRLLTRDDFSVELAIFERGVPPEFRAWFTQDGRPVAPEAVDLTVQLRRPGGSVDDHTFKPEGEFARGQSEVYEPHSFDYLVEARFGDQRHRWEFAAPEMQTTIGAESAGRAGVQIEAAGPAMLSETVFVFGEVKRNADRIARAVPRFTGLVREARKSLGDTVAEGEVVAVVENNETLVAFDVKAPIAGTIVERAVTTGETVTGGAPLYVIADLSTVWIDLAVPRRDHALVRAGQEVRLRADDGGDEVVAKIGTLLPFGAADSQSMLARLVQPNPDGRWRPGWFVHGEIQVDSIRVPVAVRESGLQTVHDFTVVFSQHGELYQARPLELGRRAGGFVEVLEGLRAGEDYVVENSFLIKADILKSGASHDH